MRKIRGNTIGTTMCPEKIAEKLGGGGDIIHPKEMKVVALGAKPEDTTGGKGFGTCIVMHDKKNCLVFDFGNDKGVTLKKYLDDNGIETIDAIFISHFHSDHYQQATLQELLRCYSVGSVVLPHTYIEWENARIEDDSDFQWYKKCYEAVEGVAFANGVTCCKPAEGDVYTYGGFNVSCNNVGDYPNEYYEWNYSELLYTSYTDEEKTIKKPNYNNFSMVNAVTFSGHKIVVTGDIMEPAIAKTIDVLSTAELIFVPHHGLDIRIPPSVFNHLTARHAVINAAYDEDSYLLSVSRAFAGELLKKGCRVTTTYYGEMAGFSVGEKITPVELGILAGNEIYPCGLLPGENLDTLPDGEYITYSEKIAQSIVNAPPFTYEPLRKFKLKVESSYITSEGNRTQTAYTIDTSTRPETARRTFTGGEYHDWALNIGDGQFHSVVESPNAGHLDNVLIYQIADMPDQSYRNIVLRITEKIETGAGENSPKIGGNWHTEIYKQSENYAIITAKSPIRYGTAIQRAWFAGELHDWEWVNPSMEEGIEYRTTERYKNKVVYKRLVDGKYQYRLDGEESWNQGLPGDYTGDIETALDAILGIQTELIGGDGV